MVVANGARPDRHQGQRRLPERQRQGRLQPDERVSTFVRGGYFREERDNAQDQRRSTADDRRPTTRVDDGERRRAVSLPDSERPAGARVRRRRDVPQQLPGGAGPASRRAHRPDDADQRVPTNGVGGMVQWSRALGTPNFCQRRHRLALGGRRQRGGRLDAADRHAPSRCTASRAARSAASARSCRTSSRRRRSCRHAQRARRSLAQLRRPQPRDHVATGRRRTAGDRPTIDRTCRTGTTRSSARASAALYQITDRVSVWGSIGCGFRAPTLNELYRQFRVGAMLTLANDQLGPERLVGGELGVNVAPTRELSPCAPRGSTTGSRIRCRTSRSRTQHAAAAEPRAARASGASRPTSSTAWRRLALLRRAICSTRRR